jgi:hypothetical protein
MAASDKTLGELHEVVANAFMEQVVGYKEEDKDGAVRLIRPSPALLGAAAAFLKNNNITADAEDNAALRELGEALSARRKKKLPQAALDEAADQYAYSMGSSLQ